MAVYRHGNRRWESNHWLQNNPVGKQTRKQCDDHQHSGRSLQTAVCHSADISKAVRNLRMGSHMQRSAGSSGQTGGAD